MCCIRKAWHQYTHTCLTALLSGSTWVSRYQKGKTNLETVNGISGNISWAVCKSAPRSRQITTPAPQHSVFLQAGCPSCRPTNSIIVLNALHETNGSCSHWLDSWFEIVSSALPLLIGATVSLGGQMMTRSYGWNLQRLQHSRNNSKLEGHSSCKTCAFIGTAHIVCGAGSM